MLLENKNAVIYGGGGSIGAAVARAFASEGAKVFLTGRIRGLSGEGEIHLMKTPREVVQDWAVAYNRRDAHAAASNSQSFAKEEK